MKKLEIHMPGIKTTLDGTVDNYPQGFVQDYETLIREFWRPNHPEVLGHPQETYQVTYPGYGVLTMQNRHFKLEFTKEYAVKKGYASTIEGNWG